MKLVFTPDERNRETSSRKMVLRKTEKNIISFASSISGIGATCIMLVHRYCRADRDINAIQASNNFTAGLIRVTCSLAL